MTVGTYPAHQVDFAPGIASTAVPAGGDWVEITASVLAWACKWGSEDEFTQPGAGTGTVVLNNSAGLFDPDNTSGTYYGDLLPGMWFRIKAGTTTANTDIFYAQVSPDGFQVDASQYPDSVVPVHLVDVSEFLANTDVPGSVYEIEVETDSPALWWRLGEANGTQATDASGNSRHGTYSGDATANSRAGLIVGDTDAAIGFDGINDAVMLSSFTPGNAFTIKAWVQAEPQAGEPALIYLLTTAGGLGDISLYETGASGATIDYAYTNPATGNRTLYRSTAAVFDGEKHFVEVTQSGATTNLYVDGVEGKTLISGAAANVTWPAMSVRVGSDDHSPLTRHVAGVGAFLAATIDEVAIFTSALSGARVAAHYAAGAAPWESDLSSVRVGRILDAVDYSATQRNINTGNSTLQSATLTGDAWAALLDVAKAENGSIYIDHQDAGKVRFIDRRHRWTASESLTSQITIGDGGGAEVPVARIDLKDDRIINIATMQRTGGTAVTVDESAGSPYRKRTLNETGLLYETDAESQSRGERVVAEKKDRHRRVRSVTLEPRKSTHPAWPHVFARKMNDRATVKWRPTYGGTYTYGAWIVGISQQWSARSGLTTTWYLVPVPYDATAEPYWIAGVSTAGVTTRAGY